MPSMEETRYRLHYHAMPPVNWMNDPNGFIYFAGQYHLFFQFHPYSPEWGPMHWGHLVSNDLMKWEFLSIALAPSEDYDIGGVYSGTAVEFNGTLYLFYTGITGDGRQVQCIASSTDGIRFEKHSGNPVIGTYPPEGSPDFRDPKVWGKQGAWNMLIGSSCNQEGNVLLYQSSNLFDWTYEGVFAQSDGSLGTMWECPDFFMLENEEVLMLSPMGMHNRANRNIFLYGNLNESHRQFEYYGWRDVDGGHDFYAAQTATDSTGRRIFIAWMDMWGAPMPSKQEGWAGAMTLPRMIVKGDEGRLLTPPVPEVELLRRAILTADPTRLPMVISGTTLLSEVAGNTLEIIVEFNLSQCDAEEIGVIVRRSADGSEQTLILYHVASSRIRVDRSCSGEPLGVDYEVDYHAADGKLKLRIFVDVSSLEVFLGDAETVLTNRIFPSPDSVGTALFATGGSVEVTSLEAWALRNHEPDGEE
ncbi:hypothetical protein SY83_09130 [Paenibacillus swuensis]|uniref:Sucrose-6-phosphate hydrolase n=2 Tax=Paenibacillus swuensis TaxID=1178515 RepID=A0A172TP52_9BACL|nr:hypothetical protein SY83_09130 [Paenibacillus swuensis]